jgi:hypothetical protein
VNDIEGLRDGVLRDVGTFELEIAKALSQRFSARDVQLRHIHVSTQHTPCRAYQASHVAGQIAAAASHL